MKKIALMMILAMLPMLANAYTWTKPGEAVRMTWFDTAAPDYYMRLLEEGTVSNPTAPLSDLKLQASPKTDDSQTLIVFKEDGDGTFLTVAKSEKDITMYGCSEAKDGQRLLIKSKGTLPHNQKPLKGGWLHLTGVDDSPEATYLLLLSSDGKYYIVQLLESDGSVNF